MLFRSAYTGKVHLTSTDGQALLPADYTFTIGAGGDNGVHTFSATLETSGSQTLTATGTATSSDTGTSCGIAVSVEAATPVAVSAPSTATAGTAFNFTVTALDQFNNTATGYAGAVHITSSDGQATLPGNYTFTTGTSGDNGVHTFSAALITLGSQTLTATDTTTSSITGTSGSIAVSAAAATHVAVSAPSTATAGTAFSFTVTVFV